MLENIVRHIEMGEGPVKAALNGSREIGFTIVSMTLSLVAVFIPILFMGGILGRLFSEFAVTIGAAILISGLIALTLTPMLCSHFLRSHAEQPPSRLYDASERIYDGMLGLYKRSLVGSWNRRHHGFPCAGLAATVWLFGVLGFIPARTVADLRIDGSRKASWRP
jgi:HAE1 family hydrophobic/amphiphilic exporter-1